MQEEQFNLETIINTFTKSNKKRAKKRLIFDQTELKGIGAKWVIAFFFSLPVMLYMGIFNDAVFSMLGIAQAIIFFIVFLSMVMILVIATTFINNNKVIRQIEPSWKNFFPGIDLKWVLSSGATPYKDFFQHYGQALKEDLKGESLQSFMKDAFETMASENSELLEAMNNSRDKR